MYKVFKNLFKVMLVSKSYECFCLYISVNLNKGEINCFFLKIVCRFCLVNKKVYYFIYRKIVWMIVKIVLVIFNIYILSICKIIDCFYEVWCIIRLSSLRLIY